jgi:hypothetical protein
MIDFEAGRAALDDLMGWAHENVDEDRNEASTRFHLIDRLVENVLG